MLGLFLLLAAAVLGFVVWALWIPEPMPEAFAALRTNENILIETDPWLVFQINGAEVETGLIVYPGARVDARSYAPMARSISEKGYLVVVPKMPLNLAVFSPNKAAEIQKAYPNIKTWIIAGHSLGGTMAARFASKNPQSIRGLVLLASYPLTASNLQNTDLPVISIYGSNDGLATLDDVRASKENLPGSTKWVEIVGGNHAQFAWYGDQSGDRKAEISRAEQQNRVTFELISFLETITVK